MEHYWYATLTNRADDSVVFGSGYTGSLYYLEEGCIGQPFIISPVWVVWDDQADEYFVIEENPTDSILFLSNKSSARVLSNGTVESTGQCNNTEAVQKAAPAIPYYPAQELVNAVYPVRAVQLP